MTCVVTMQTVPAALAGAHQSNGQALLVKWSQFHDGRDFSEFLMDSSKQLIGALSRMHCHSGNGFPCCDTAIHVRGSLDSPLELAIRVAWMPESCWQVHACPRPVQLRSEGKKWKSTTSRLEEMSAIGWVLNMCCSAWAQLPLELCQLASESWQSGYRHLSLRYWINIVVDCTLGVACTYVLLQLSTRPTVGHHEASLEAC